MMVVSRGRLLSKGSFPLMAGTRAWDLGGFLARLKGHGGAPGVGGLQVQPPLLGPGQRRQVIGQLVQFLAHRSQDLRFRGENAVEAEPSG